MLCANLNTHLLFPFVMIFYNLCDYNYYYFPRRRILLAPLGLASASQAAQMCMNLNRCERWDALTLTSRRPSRFSWYVLFTQITHTAQIKHAYFMQLLQEEYAKVYDLTLRQSSRFSMVMCY